MLDQLGLNKARQVTGSPGSHSSTKRCRRTHHTLSLEHTDTQRQTEADRGRLGGLLGGNIFATTIEGTLQRPLQKSSRFTVPAAKIAISRDEVRWSHRAGLSPEHTKIDVDEAVKEVEAGQGYLIGIIRPPYKPSLYSVPRPERVKGKTQSPKSGKGP